MEDIESLKQARTKAKQSVTVSAKRLSSSAQRQSDIDVLRNLMTDLEKAFCDFLDIDEQFAELVITEKLDTHRVVNNEDLQEYKETVTNTYTSAKDLYKAMTQEQGTNLTRQPQVTCTLTKDYQTHTSSPCTYSSGTSMPWTTGETTFRPSLFAAPPSNSSYYHEPREQRHQYMTSETGLFGNPMLIPTFPTRPYHQNTPQQPVFGVGTHNMQPANTHFNTDVKLKKLSFPTFSGERKDWPEFKAIWKELAEHSGISKTALAHELKCAVHGEAAQRVKSVYVTKPEAYDVMWQKLELYYEDTTASVQAVLENLSNLHSVKENDFKGLVALIDEVEASYSQLQELNEIHVLTMRDVDQITRLLPSNIKYEWIRKYQRLTAIEKIHPFSQFMDFLDLERQAVIRLVGLPAEENPTLHKAQGVKKQQAYSHQSEGKSQEPDRRKKFYRCAFTAHRKEGIKHDTSECLEFKKLTLTKRYELLKQVYACFICFGDHRKDKCPNKKPCVTCNRTNHHYLLCKEKEQQQTAKSSTSHAKTETQSKTICNTPALSLYPIQKVAIPRTGKYATVFCDGGSNTTYITHSAAEKFHAKKLDNFSLDVTTMGDVQKTYNTCQYEVNLQTQTGKSVKVTAFGMDRITGPVSRLDTDVLQDLFPDYNVNLLQRQSTTVDLLLGCDNFGLHPKQEVARAGENLSIMQGQLGVCIQGSHSLLKEETKMDSNLVKTIHEIYPRAESFYTAISNTHREFVSPSNYPTRACTTVHSEAEVSPAQAFKWYKDDSGNPQSCQINFANQQKNMHIGSFVEGEELATETTPKCGGCKCGKCPTIGHTYSFKEEQELKMIRDNLSYDEDRQCWVTSYPWIVDPNELPENYNATFSTLLHTERTLKKDPEWAEKYKLQIQDMLERNVARKLSKEEMETWTGPTFYISHLAVFNPKSNSTPVRIVFNSSQLYKGTSLNTCLAKGPDCYLNSLLAILLRWREQKIAVVGDIKKMFNSVHLQPLEQHCHRFLWRDLQEDKRPDTYVITRVNFGDKPAPAISSEAIYQTAEKFCQDSQKAAELLKKSSYVDDLIDSFPTLEETEQITSETEDMLKKGGFQIKCWQFSGEKELRTSAKQGKLPSSGIGKQPQLKGTNDSLQVLGVGWKPVEDVIVFQTTLNFSKKKRGVRTGPDLTEIDIPDSLPVTLTRRIVLEQVMTIFDPLGLICPFTLLAKIYLRETWQLQLDWDDQLPYVLYIKWISFFKTMFELEQIQVERCLKPKEAIGRPWLIILSDGSNQAFGFAAYILWKLANGEHWCRLIMAKCRIAPLKRVSTPQMELNGAVLSKRARIVIEKEMRFDFERILHLVDSETVLNMINKTSTRFKVYEGVRIGEIQAASAGDMSSWAWISGENNTADWLTRGRLPHQLGADSEWQNGPAILYQQMDQWALKKGLQQDTSLPGEKKMASSSTATAKVPLLNYEQHSSIDKIIWIVARVRNIAKMQSFRGGNVKHITPADLRDAENFIVRDAQSTIQEELQKTNKASGIGGRYSRLNPVKGPEGIWVVGQRLQRFNAMSADAELQKLLPTSHPVTKLFMLKAHQRGHKGRTATLAMFRQHYWTPHGDKLAKSVKRNCQMCKLREPVLLSQQMGLLPECRLKPGPPFNHVMVDLFGPYTVRGEVQKRVSGKAYGVIFTDLASRAVHIEAVYGYDTGSFLMALSRFASIRGWPEVIYSDPGSQLVGAERQLKEAWDRMDRNLLIRTGTQNGLRWVFGPADTPWHQGAVESLVKSAKRAIHYAVHNQRLSVPEFLVVCTEVANLLNERPIGVTPSEDSDINVLTPNNLLLGRATAKNPSGWQPFGSIKDRYNLVQYVCDQFWKNWTELYTPTLVIRQKWSTSQRNLKPGDIVIIADRNTLRGMYRLGLVKEVFPGKDGKVRQVSLTYKNYKVGEKSHVYSGAKDITVTRSVQRLALLVPVDD